MLVTMRKKLVVVGDSCCGKTSLLTVFAHGNFPDQYLPTVFDTYIKDFETDGSNVELALWDTAGDESYERLRPLSYPDTDVVVICYSIENVDSFNNVADLWAPEMRHFLPLTPIVLIANKKDLRYNVDAVEKLAKSNRQPLTSLEGRAMAKRIKASAFLECSAKFNDGVIEVFETAVRESMKNVTRTTNQRKFCWFF